MKIKIDDLSSNEIEEFLDQHIQDMKSVSPPESKHALDLNELRSPDVTFWAVWDNQQIVGCGALKVLDSAHAEIKSMRVSTTRRGQGIASILLKHILKQAEFKGYKKLSLETGSMPFFVPARKLYENFGFGYCAPFDKYLEDSNSVFMTLYLNANV